MKNSIRWIFIAMILIGLAGGVAAPQDNVLAERMPAPNLKTLCGSGSANDNYGFTYPLQQLHWTVNWDSYLNSGTVDEIDQILDRLNEDSIAQTMILILPQAEVGIPTNCAVHFLRYMQLGLPDGERQDNGFTFLVIVKPNGIDTHYGVGLGLPALTAQGLSPINRLAEDTYQQTGSLDDAMLVMVRAYDGYARSKVEPYYPDPSAPQSSVQLPSLPALSALPPIAICVGLCLLCIGMIVLLMIVNFLTRLMRGGGRGFRFPSSGWTPGPRMPSPRWNPGPSMPRGPTFRGGSGGGRSGRGN